MAVGSQIPLFVGPNIVPTDGLLGSRQEITRETIEVQLGIVEAETWPARYKMHKYWGRKPANVVERYVEFFSRPGDVVIDPFAGSGVTVLEAARLQRTAFGFDLNPLAVKLSSAMLRPPEAHAFASAARFVMDRAHQAVASLYVTNCDHCGAQARLRSVGYVGDKMRDVRYRCEVCRRSGAHSPTDQDAAIAARHLDIPADAPDDDVLFGWEMQKLKRRGVKRWSEMFTPRNFLAAAELRRAILDVEDPVCQSWLLLTLTASLAQFSRMIADSSGDAGGPSWKINCYWLPDRWQELNPLWYFENRVGKSMDAIHDLWAQGAPFVGANVRTADSRHLPLSDASVDYIFTDPPYGGEGIQYGELSLLWCLWLGDRENLDAEIAFNPHRKLDQEHYSAGLRRVFAECFRVLKPGKWMTVTFANKDPIVWDALMSACRSAGFSLVTAAPMKRSAPSLTETTMHTAPKSDLVLSFLKPANPNQAMPATSSTESTYSLDTAVRRVASAMVKGEILVTAHAVFDRVTVDWFSWFYEKGARPEAVAPTLANVESALVALSASGLKSKTTAHRSAQSAPHGDYLLRK